MQYVCDAPPNTWFRIETEGEAALEIPGHEPRRREIFPRSLRAGRRTPTCRRRSAHYVEQNIGLKAHIQRVMPRFLTLRDGEGKALVTAMLPPAGQDERAFRPIIVGFENTDPYHEFGNAIGILGEHSG